MRRTGGEESARRGAAEPQEHRLPGHLRPDESADAVHLHVGVLSPAVAAAGASRAAASVTRLPPPPPPGERLANRSLRYTTRAATPSSLFTAFHRHRLILGSVFVFAAHPAPLRHVAAHAFETRIPEPAVSDKKQ